MAGRRRAKTQSQSETPAVRKPIRRQTTKSQSYRPQEENKTKLQGTIVVTIPEDILANVSRHAPRQYHQPTARKKKEVSHTCHISNRKQ